MRIALVYTSKTGNTEALMEVIKECFKEQEIDLTVSRVEHFPLNDLARFNAIVIGTYTWGNGEIPSEMMKLYRAFEQQSVKNVVTGVAGTGDSGYHHFCGAVDEFRNMLYVHTNLAVTLKIEVVPQPSDIDRCRRFVKAMGTVLMVPHY
jgi:flavodoxin I